MFTLAAAPLWVAILALVGTVATPIVQGRIGRTNSKADAAEKFTRIAEGVAEDYEKVRDELREIKPLLRQLIILIDKIAPDCPNERSEELGVILDKLRDRIY